MTNNPAAMPIDRNDERIKSAAEAEQRLFAHYGLNPRAHHVDVNELGIRVRVLEVGTGPSVLLVPGGNGEAFQFAPLMAHLQGWRLIVLDRPGAGMSDGVDHRRVDLRRLAVDSLTSVLDAFELESAPVIGSSMGGLWALWLALDRPERVAMMVQAGCPALLLGTSAPPPMRLLSVPVLNRLIFPVANPGSADKARDMLGMLGCSDATTRALPDAFPETMYRMFDLPGYRTAWLSLMESVLQPRGAATRYRIDQNELSRVEQATLFIWGDNDVFGGVEVAQRAVTIMPDSRLAVVSGSHVPFLDDAAECARIIEDFLPRAPETTREIPAGYASQGTAEPVATSDIAHGTKHPLGRQEAAIEVAS